VDVRLEWRRLVAAAACAGLALAGGACFSPSLDSCAIRCGEANACPEDHVCLADGMCHASQDEPLCIPGDDASLVDAPIDQPDGGGRDSGVPDAQPRIDAAFDAGTPVTPTSTGDLVISEIHKDPFAAQDPVGEWFEVFNPTEQTFDLRGLSVSDNGTDVFDIDESLVVAPGGRLVFARLSDPDQNGGVIVDFAYGELFFLGNGPDEVIIDNLDAAVRIDSVFYDVATFPDTEGASISLDPDAHDAALNNEGGNWCDGQDSFGLGDLGSPGGPNPECPVKPARRLSCPACALFFMGRRSSPCESPSNIAWPETTSPGRSVWPPRSRRSFREPRWSC
jgi:hypothetical protein